MSVLTILIGTLLYSYVKSMETPPPPSAPPHSIALEAKELDLESQQEKV